MMFGQEMTFGQILLGQNIWIFGHIPIPEKGHLAKIQLPTQPGGQPGLFNKNIR